MHWHPRPSVDNSVEDKHKAELPWMSSKRKTGRTYFKTLHTQSAIIQYVEMEGVREEV